MQPIRLIAMDMDGTLLTRLDPVTACIPPENAVVLRQAQSRGVHLALASGRMPDDASFFAADAGIPMHIISLNGGMTLDSPLGQPCSSRFLPQDTADTVLRILIDADVDVAVFGAWEVVALRPHPLSWAQRELGTYFGRSGGRLTYRSAGEGLERLRGCTAKIVAFSTGSTDALNAAKARIHARCPEVVITSSWHNNFEVNAAGVHKGSALVELAGRLGIPMERVMAIGDNDNDVPMLKAAGCAVAMGNASTAARNAATHITLSNQDHGVAAAIRALVFGENVPGVIKCHP